MEIPERTLQKLQESKMAYDRWVALVKAGKNVWTADQEKQLAGMYDILAATHDALWNLVMENNK